MTDNNKITIKQINYIKVLIRDLNAFMEKFQQYPDIFQRYDTKLRSDIIEHYSGFHYNSPEKTYFIDSQNVKDNWSAKKSRAFISLLRRVLQSMSSDKRQFLG